jgi:uncharacterized membrane protein
MVIVSVALLVVYVDHIGKSLRVSSLIELVGSATRRTLDHRYPQTTGARPETDPALVRAPRSGVLSHIDEPRLVSAATRAGCRLDVEPALGDFVPAGAVLVRVHGSHGSLDKAEVLRSLSLNLDRSLDQDVAYGIRMLVDIAERSLAESPFLDPTTAVQAIDRLHDCLRQLACRPFPPRCIADEGGRPRLCVQQMEWRDYLELAFREIRLSGRRSPQITRRLENALLDLRSVALDDRRSAVDEQLALLRASVDDEVDARDAPAALVSDRQGMGGSNEHPSHRIADFG